MGKFHKIKTTKYKHPKKTTRRRRRDWMVTSVKSVMAAPVMPTSDEHVAVAVMTARRKAQGAWLIAGACSSQMMIASFWWGLGFGYNFYVFLVFYKGIIVISKGGMVHYPLGVNGDPPPLKLMITSQKTQPNMRMGMRKQWFPQGRTITANQTHTIWFNNFLLLYLCPKQGIVENHLFFT